MALLTLVLPACREDRAADKSDNKAFRAAISVTASGLVSTKVSSSLCWDPRPSIAVCMDVGDPGI